MFTQIKLVDDAALMDRRVYLWRPLMTRTEQEQFSFCVMIDSLFRFKCVLSLTHTHTHTPYSHPHILRYIHMQSMMDALLIVQQPVNSLEEFSILTFFTEKSD